MNSERDIYKDDIDFSILALQSPEFNKFLKSNGQLDFSNPEAVKYFIDLNSHPYSAYHFRQLTMSLLKRDFGLDLHLPDDRLCPPVPNRLNYILWIQDLLDTTSDSYADRFEPVRQVIGLDMYKLVQSFNDGTGASCIYPLLGCTQRSSWKFVATDIDEKNIAFAKENIIANDLKPRIRPLKLTSKDPLIPLDMLDLECIDFTICNPPFYSSAEELVASAALKSRPPYSACTGSEIEMVTPGGEVSFVGRMIEESCSLKGKVQWYTSMLGKFSSISSVIEKFKEKGVNNWAVREFIQGGRTKRWGVAWSWRDMRPKMDIARGALNVPKQFLPYPSEFIIAVHNSTVESIASHANSILQPLDLQWQYRSKLSAGIGFTKANVWSRSARRNKQRKFTSSLSAPPKKFGFQDMMDEDSNEKDEHVLGFKLEIRQNSEENITAVTCRWLKGNDAVLFESFCGMLKRQLISN